MVTILSFDVGVKNLAYCLFEYHNLEDFQIQEWNILDLVCDVVVERKSGISLNNQCDVLLCKLKELFETTHIDYVLIENQPVLKNPTMKTIQIIIYTYFRMLKVNEEKSITDVVFVNANNKVKFVTTVLSKKPEMNIVVSPVPSEPSSSNNGRSRYKHNKEVAVNGTRCLLQYVNHNDSLNYFCSCKKKDDLADTFLQGLYYAHNVLRVG